MQTVHRYAPKYSQDAPFISIGLAKDNDIYLTDWNATVIAAQEILTRYEIKRMQIPDAVCAYKDTHAVCVRRGPRLATDCTMS